MYEKLLHFIYSNADLPYLTKKVWFLFHLNSIWVIPFRRLVLTCSACTASSLAKGFQFGVDQKPLASLHSLYERIHVKKIVFVFKTLNSLWIIRILKICYKFLIAVIGMVFIYSNGQTVGKSNWPFKDSGFRGSNPSLFC